MGVLGERPDVVIVATGSRPRRPRWALDPPPGSPRLADVTEVLDGSARPSGTVLVVDELGFHQAPSVAELLATRGCVVEIATPAMVVGGDLDLTGDLEGFNRRAAARQITQSTDLVVMALEPGGIQLLHNPTGTVARRIVDWVVLAVAPACEDRLYRLLRGEAPGARRAARRGLFGTPPCSHGGRRGRTGRGEHLSASWRDVVVEALSRHFREARRAQVARLFALSR